MIPHADVLLVSREEAVLLTGEERIDAAAEALCALGPEQVVLRLGADGALALDKEGRIKRDEAIAVNPVEVVGAGDAFNAGYLAGQLRGWDIAQSLRLGNVLGGLATTVHGDVEGLPTWEEVQPYLNGNHTSRVTDR
jgi:2-dehydro-3-deoxygluconokinase